MPEALVTPHKVTRPAPLPRSFYRRDAVTVARELLGQRLVRVLDGMRLSGIIVETEAYLGQIDRAAHSFRGRTTRNASMWLDGGHAYVYFIYGFHYCTNVVAGEAGHPVAVLLRALQPEEGADVMHANRPKATDHTHLCSGPGKLCQALGIKRDLDGNDLTAGDTLWIERARRRALDEAKIVTTHRVGVAYAGEWARKPLRFYLKSNPHVSKR